MVLTRVLEFLYVIALRIAVVLDPVNTEACFLIQIIADVFGHLPHFLSADIGVLAPVCIVPAGRNNGSPTQE